MLVNETEAIKQEERLSEKSPPIVIVNAPVDFSEVVSVYPNSKVVYYANDTDEASSLVNASGIEQAVALLPNPLDLKNCLRFGYDNLHHINFKGVLTRDFVDPAIAQSMRTSLLTYDTHGSCFDCHLPRTYAFVQAQILGIKSQTELGGKFPEERLKVLYGLDSLMGKVEDLDELPMLGKIGPLCYHCLSPLVHEAFGRLSTERMCEGAFKHTYPSMERFREEYRDLCEKYGVNYPEKKI